jgi:hypothetical protein
MEARVKLAIATGLFAAVAVFNLGSPPVHADDMVDYRANHEQAGCRVVEIQTTNRWGTDVTIRRLVCG